MQITICYFAWVRERIGVGQETLTLTQASVQVEDVVKILSQKSPIYAEIFSDLTGLRFALNQAFSELDRFVSDGDELAVFPPMTGGD